MLVYQRVDPSVPFSDAHIYPASHIGSPTRCVQWQRLRCGSWRHCRISCERPSWGKWQWIFWHGLDFVWKIARGVLACQYLSIRWMEPFGRGAIWKGCHLDAKSSTTVTCLERNGLRSKQYAVWKGSAWVTLLIISIHHSSSGSFKQFLKGRAL